MCTSRNQPLRFHRPPPDPVFLRYVGKGMDNEKVKKGLQIFGAILMVICLVGAIWSIFRPGANAPLTPDEQKKMDELDRQAK